MREKSSECQSQATSQVRAMTEMCSREPSAGVLQQHHQIHNHHHHVALGKPTSNGKSPSSPLSGSGGGVSAASSPEGRLVIANHEDSDSQGARSNSAGSNNNAGTAGDNGSANNLPTPGGRLKFFKDGKFILELSHRRDGERTTWFPVPKKTFWPPPPSSLTPSRQESSASLSVSDDNSSIQSSPWQRDHCWKQSNPRRNISTEYNFYYRRNPKVRLRVHPRLIACKRRQPWNPSSSLVQLQEYQKQPQPRNKLNGASSNSKSLSIIIDKLARLMDPNVVSPRKRILRELERVSLGDQVSKRRATPPQATSNTVIEPPAPTASKQLSSYSITSILGEDKASSTAPSGPESSSSSSSEPGFLRSLLKPQERQAQAPPPQASPHRSPHHHPRHSPQHQSHPLSPQHQPHRHSPQQHRYSPQQHRHSPQQHRNSPQHQTLAQLSPQHHPQSAPLPPPPTQLYQPRAAARLDPVTAAYLGAPGMVAASIHQPLYGLPMLPPAAYRAPPFCWMHYSQPVHYAQPPMPVYAQPPQPPHLNTPSPSPPAHRSYKDYREQALTPPSDMPLNLSKHAG
ncbi:hypothetical protein QAD02_004247 [Eretmocerus hayati]|uniref:Uncharacterized protein n=1 Tax=Eretmocerus hayati TaxID=131215 RepID=A0ACC2NQU3_9HYME|nr:hypothetical protein QAD02_004247 [Eretmocerus hayati]